jgi:hypothetical protein
MLACARPPYVCTPMHPDATRPAVRACGRRTDLQEQEECKKLASAAKVPSSQATSVAEEPSAPEEKDDHDADERTRGMLLLMSSRDGGSLE